MTHDEIRVFSGLFLVAIGMIGDFKCIKYSAWLVGIGIFIMFVTL